MIINTEKYNMVGGSDEASDILRARIVNYRIISKSPAQNTISHL